MHKTFASLFALAVMALPVAAEAKEPLVTDRPDIAESSVTVGHRVYQIEQGITYEGAGSVVSTLFPSLHRFGFGDSLELRVETPILNLTGGVPAFQELAVGGKWHFAGNGELGQMPSLGLLANAGLNQTGGIEPTAKLALDADLPMDFAINANIGATLPAGNAAPTALAAASVTRGFGDFTAFLELSGGRDFQAATDELGVDTGLQYLINDDFQWDFGIYKGLTATSTEWYFTTGLSVRYGLFE
ncbi:MAG: transporter [Candidatus Sericytochromatia bacterium]